jgi:predicted component of type VI protein secretion system
VSDLIFVEQAPEQGKEHSLSPGTTIGREDCDITIPDPEMSRRQAQVLRDGDAVVIEDLGSTNGTFVNGQRITGRQTLENGDEVRFGATVWKLKAPLQAPPGATRQADIPVADPQVTRARAIPEPATAQTAAKPTPAPAPAAPAAAPAAPAGPSRGDVPAPDFQPSVIRRVVPPPGAPAAFTPDTSPRGRGRGGRSGSAATRVSATVFTTLVTALTAAGVVIYYITEPFK